MTERPVDWWRHAVVYQIYPRSFQDSNDDGIGDLEGIIQRLDYLNDGTPNSLGVDAIWLSPTFPSPMADFGYDVSDYCGVHPDFGTMATMERLIRECHARGIRLLLDWVPNHTSDQHPWFQESRSSRSNPRRDWYIWRDARADGSLPNNWRSVFGGPAWTLDPATGQYYLHSFLREQPDLNWRNPEVERAMLDTLRFWFDKGVDGFRIDVMGMIVKHPDLADNPPNPEWRRGDRERASQIWLNNRNYPDVYEAVKRIRAVFDEYEDRMAVGEVFGSAAEVAGFYGDDDEPGLHLAFNFQFIHEKEGEATRWEAEAIRRIVRNAESALPHGAQPCYAIGNHDRPRFNSRHNGDGRGFERARAAAVLLMGLRNTPFVYYGEEIGMEDVDIPEQQLRDPARIRTIGRDPERTPMQWDSGEGRGFTRGEPWLPFGRVDRNVADQTHDTDSLLALYRRAIWFRKRCPALLDGGTYELAAPRDVIAWVRSAPGNPAVAVAVNTAREAREVRFPGGGTVVLSTRLSDEGGKVQGAITLPPLGAVIVQQPG